MGIYLNPGNSGFVTMRKKNYVDKSGLIHLINESIDSNEKMTCVSRPRRFGKSYAAKMLCAYYDKTCVPYSKIAGQQIKYLQRCI